MRLLIFISILFISTSNFAQDGAPKTKNKFRTGISSNIGMGHRLLTQSTETSTSQWIFDYRNKIETPAIAWSLGGAIQYKINRNFDLETGFQFEAKRYKVKKMSIPPSIYMEDQIEAFRTKYSFTYASIPLFFNCNFGKGKIRFASTIGFKTNLFLYNRNSSTLYFASGKKKRSGNISNIYNFNRINFSPEIAIGVENKLNETAFTKFQLYANFNTRSIIEAPIHEYLWTTGIRFSYFFGSL